VRLGRHPALAGQCDDGLAYRNPADPQLRRDIVLRDALAGVQPIVEDHPANVVGDLLRAGGTGQPCAGDPMSPIPTRTTSDRMTITTS